jgi:hypothetical protein
MKTLHDFAKTLTDALAAMEGAKAAEERARLAQQAASQGLANAEKARIAAARIKADADAYADAHKAEQDKVDAELKAVRDREKSQHTAWIENAKGQVEAASATLEAINKAIGEKRGEHDALSTEIGQMRARLTDAVSKF